MADTHVNNLAAGDTALGGETPVTGSFVRKLTVVLTCLIILLLCFGGIGLMFALKKKPEPQKRRNPTLAVVAEKAYSDTVVLDVRVQGQTRPRTEIDLVPQVGGKITYVSPRFVAGGVFNKGDVLLRIEEADFNVSVIRSEAAVARARQVVIREKAESEIARKDWEELGDGSEPTDLTLRKPQMAEAEAGLQSAMADLENSKLQLSRTQVIAPFNGRIRERFVDIGQFVGPGTRLARIFSTDVIEVPLSLTDADLTRLDVPIAYYAKDRAAAPDVRLSAIIAGERRFWDGKIVRTDSTYNTQTRAISAIAEVLDPYNSGAAIGGFPLAPGLFVDADIVGKTYEDAIIISRDALRPEDKIYVVNEKGIAESRDAEVIDTNAERAVIAAGIEAGELIILSPLEKSQISLTFKVLDADDPTQVIVEPPKPEWQKKLEADEKNKANEKDKKKKRRWGKKKKDADKKPPEDKSDEEPRRADGGDAQAIEGSDQ